MKTSLPLLFSMLCASVALAEAPDAPSLPDRARKLVDEQLLQPLRKAEPKRKKFSRAAPPPKERRVRVLDSTAQADARGKLFVRFAVDELFPWDEPDDWRNDAFVGCVYPADGEVFLKERDGYLPARRESQRKHRPVADVCRPAPAEPATANGGAPAAERVDA